MVVIHDAVRPFVSSDVMERIAVAAYHHGVCFPQAHLYTGCHGVYYTEVHLYTQCPELTSTSIHVYIPITKHMVN